VYLEIDGNHEQMKIKEKEADIDNFKEEGKRAETINLYQD
jgi:hypothetical protein